MAATSKHTTIVPFDVMKAAIPKILNALPEDWRGTTFDNSNLLGREQFAQNLCELIVSRGDGDITQDDLHNIGNAEDYLRVATNIATTLEVALAAEKGWDVSRVFTFASTAMPIIAVCLATSKPVHLYTGDEAAPFNDKQLQLLKLLGCEFEFKQHGGCAQDHKDSIVLSLASAPTKDEACVHGIVSSNALYITNTQVVRPEEILVVRKRLATPLTTPMAERQLQELSRVTITADQSRADDDAVRDFLHHLQEMSGTAANDSAPPVVCTAGLPTICSIWVTLVGRGGADILMCSTAYGGSSQLTDVINQSTEHLRKHVFHIQGSQSIVPSVKKELEVMASSPDKLFPYTVLFTEIPTNPDMKVPDMEELVQVLKEYKQKTGKHVLLLLDTTFAPASRLLEKFKQMNPELTAMCFISLSKSVSRGKTTAGTVVANHTDTATSIVREIAENAAMLDVTAKPDQMYTLTQNHTGVEQRCEKAYSTAVQAGNWLMEAVKTHSGVEMGISFVSPEHAKMGFTTSTFSFNLPPPEGASQEEKEALAQTFVDHLTVHPVFKPCVSFGQDNGRVYATVPATSTQGAIKAEDKAKQAVGGVQLTRLSFSPTPDMEALQKVMVDAVAKIYAKKT